MNSKCYLFFPLFKVHVTCKRWAETVRCSGLLYLGYGLVLICVREVGRAGVGRPKREGKLRKLAALVAWGRIRKATAAARRSRAPPCDLLLLRRFSARRGGWIARSDSLRGTRRMGNFAWGFSRPGMRPTHCARNSFASSRTRQLGGFPSVQRSRRGRRPARQLGTHRFVSFVPSLDPHFPIHERAHDTRMGELARR